MSKNRYSLEVDDLGIEYADQGPWRSYSLQTEGNNLEQMIENASVSEIDQDGGEIQTYELTSRGGEVYRFGVGAIESYLERKTRQENEAAKDHAINHAIDAAKEGKGDV